MLGGYAVLFLFVLAEVDTFYHGAWIAFGVLLVCLVILCQMVYEVKRERP